MRALATVVVVASISAGTCVEAEKSMLAHRARKSKINLDELNMAMLNQLKKEEVRSATSLIAEEMEKINISNGMGKVALWSMKTSIKRMERIDPTSAAILQNVSSLFDDLLALLLNETVVGQAVIDSYNVTLANCFTTLPENDAYWRSRLNESNVNHTACRTIELGLFNTDVTECGELTTYLNSLYNPVCTFPNATVDKITDWTSFFNNGENWFNTSTEGYIPLRDDCVESTVILEAKIAECNIEQQNYESVFCQYRGAHMVNCAVQDQCDNTTRDGYDNITTTYAPLGDSRVYLVRMILHVQCLVDNLAQGITDKTLCGFNDTEDLQAYNYTFPVLMAQPVCDMSEVTPYPGDPTFQSVFYAHLSVNTPPFFPYFVSCPADNVTYLDMLAGLNVR